jgi:UDP-2-acetamido-3-amino-2,3-dideoxy-glucuronate N-acetyltransferase
LTNSTPIAKDVQLGREDERTLHPDLENLCGCSVRDEARIRRFIEVQAFGEMGARCKVSSDRLICEGVTIEDKVFHGVTFTNDRHPRATTANGGPQGPAEWAIEPSRVDRRASIGSTILCGLTVGAATIVGAGAVVHAGFSRMRDCGASVCAHSAGVRAGPRAVGEIAPSGRRFCL